MNKYFIPENLVMRICMHMEGSSLCDNDYLDQFNDGSNENYIFKNVDKEYIFKSMVMNITQDGVIHNCCPLHVNPGITSTMKLIREKFRIGKGNINFGSTFIVECPDKNVKNLSVISMQKQIGCTAIICAHFDNQRYIDEMIRNKIIPLLIESEAHNSYFNVDDYILLKDIRKNILEKSSLEAYVISKDYRMSALSIKLPNLSDEQIRTLLEVNE